MTTTRDPAVLAWVRLMRVHARIERAAADQLRGAGLTVPQFDILAHLVAAPGLTQQELADRRLTTKGNLSQVLDTMETCGLIERERHGRIKRVNLTPRGRDLFEATAPGHEAEIARRLCPLSADELGTLRSLLRKLDRPA
jgi:MarR family 2-MHQ and catechol resistance regulon transcriptional repressor